MRTEHGILTYTRTRCKLIREHLGVAGRVCSIDSVHDMRVEIKRLKAVFALVEWVNASLRAAEHLATIKKLYRAAGKVRDIHVMTDICWREKATGLEISELLNELKVRELAAANRFMKAADSFDSRSVSCLPQVVSRGLSGFTIPEIAVRTEKRLEGSLRVLARMAERHENVSPDLHGVRIKCKETRYTLEMLRQCGKDAEALEEPNKLLRGVHRALGKWHDCDVTLAFVQVFQESGLQAEPYDPESYSRLQDNLDQSRSAHLTEFRDRWEQLTERLPDFYHLWGPE